MTIFVDTSAFVAILNRTDRFHQVAQPAWVRWLEVGEPLVTTNYIVSEACAIIQNRMGMTPVSVFFTQILPVVQLEWIDSSLHQKSVDALLAANRRQLSLVDCTSFVAMRQLALNTVFAFDPHFAEQGFTVLPTL